MTQTRLQSSQTLDVRQCTSAVFDHINRLREQLSEDQLKLFNDVCVKTKQNYYDSIPTWSYQQLKQFSKFQETERLATELHEQYPAIHSDLFKKSMHYMLNGAQERVEVRMHVLKTEKKKVKDVARQPHNTLKDDGEPDVAKQQADTKHNCSALTLSKLSTDTDVHDDTEEGPKNGYHTAIDGSILEQVFADNTVTLFETPSQMKQTEEVADPADDNPQATSTPMQAPLTTPIAETADINLQADVADVNTLMEPPDVHASPMGPIQDDTNLHAAIYSPSPSEETVTTPKPVEKSLINSPATSPDKNADSSDMELSTPIVPLKRKKKKDKKKKKKQPKKKKTYQPGNHCLGPKSCKYNGSADGDMLRCIFCYRWYHCDCTNSNVTDDGAWPCPGCRKMPGTIEKLESQMKKVLELNNEIVKKCTHLITELSSCQARNVALEAENDDLVAENNRLKNNLRTLEDKVSRITEEVKKLRDEKRVSVVKESHPKGVAPPVAPANHAPPAPAPTTYDPVDLLIGDSIVRDVESKSKCLKVVALGGATTTEVRDYLRKAKSDSYGCVTVVIGTNDCSKHTSKHDFQQNYDMILKEACRVARSKVLASSILPRGDDQEMPSIIPEFNGIIKELCVKHNTVYIDNDSNFMYVNGMPDFSTLLKDHVHLNKKGTLRLCRNLNVEDFNVRKRPPPTNQNGQPQAPRSSEAYSHPYSGYGSRNSNGHRADYNPRYDKGYHHVKNNDRGSSISQRGSDYNPWRKNADYYSPHTYHTDDRGSIISQRESDHYPKRRNADYYSPHAYHTDERVEKNSNVVCDFCGENGHVTKVCRHGDYIQCGLCGEYGHKKKHHRDSSFY
jgi:hypothetical protein